MEKERLVSFELLGQEYKFYTAASEEELRNIFNLVRQLFDTGSSMSSGTIVSGKLAILACLNIASRYVQLENEFNEYRLDSEERICRLREEIRTTLLAE